MKKYYLAILAASSAILITATMDFTGYTLFSALPLLLVIIIFQIFTRLSKYQLGIQWGNKNFYYWAFAQAVCIPGLVALIVWIAGDINWQEMSRKSILALGVNAFIGPIVLVLTEEGFFRGWLWGFLRSKGLSNRSTWYWTTFAFVAWHISAVTSGSEYGLPLIQVPVYLVNAALLGLIWGLLRWQSGSVLVPAFAHAWWNGLVYELYGFGEKTGSLGIENTFIYGPEVGFMGWLVNGIFLYSLYYFCNQNIQIKN